MFINLETQQKEQSSVVFINESTKIHQTMSNLRNCLKYNQFIDCAVWNHKKWHPRYDLPQTCGGSKSVCPISIRPTEKLQSQTRKIFRINEHWSNKYNTHYSTINKGRLEQRSWKIFYKLQRKILDEEITEEIRITCIGLTVVP